MAAIFRKKRFCISVSHYRVIAWLSPAVHKINQLHVTSQPEAGMQQSVKTCNSVDHIQHKCKVVMDSWCSGLLKRGRDCVKKGGMTCGSLTHDHHVHNFREFYARAVIRCKWRAFHFNSLWPDFYNFYVVCNIARYSIYSSNYTVIRYNNIQSMIFLRHVSAFIGHLQAGIDTENNSGLYVIVNMSCITHKPLFSVSSASIKMADKGRNM